MLAIGVRVPRRFDDAGEYLADSRALDSAGVDSLWLDGDGHEPWLLLAGIAAVTGRMRLVAPIGALEARTPEALESRVTTLSRMSRGRVVLGFAADPSAGRDLDAVAALARRCHCSVLVSVAEEADARAAALVADGAIGLDDSPERLRESLEKLRRLREDAGLAGPFEAWARIAMPADPAEWRAKREAYAAAGAFGLIVQADPRLLDLLRNGDEEDDRSDLALAQG